MRKMEVINSIHNMKKIGYCIKVKKTSYPCFIAINGRKAIVFHIIAEGGIRGNIVVDHYVDQKMTARVKTSVRNLDFVSLISAN
jgi:hypothetical protein